MSERGTWTTNFIYCGDTVKALRECFQTQLCPDGKYFTVHEIATHPECGAFAGRIGGLYPGEEIDTFEQMIPDIESVISCEIRIAVLGEQGERLFKIKPWYEMLNQDGEVIAFFHGQPELLSRVRAEDVWHPNGRQPSPGEKMPEDIARCIRNKSVRRCGRPDFIGAPSEGARPKTDFGQMSPRQLEWAEKEKQAALDAYESPFFKKFSES